MVEQTRASAARDVAEVLGAMSRGVHCLPCARAVDKLCRSASSVVTLVEAERSQDLLPCFLFF